MIAHHVHNSNGATSHLSSCTCETGSNIATTWDKGHNNDDKKLSKQKDDFNDRKIRIYNL
jgi:hypothetical protein